jgi:hypothetical protein
MLDVLRPEPRAVALANDVRIAEDVPPGGNEWADPDDWAIHLKRKSLNVGHEQTHLAQSEAGVAEDEQEDFVADIELRWLVPYDQARAIVGRSGFVPTLLIDTWPHISPSRVLHRVAAISAVGGRLWLPWGTEDLVSEEAPTGLDVPIDEEWMVKEAKRHKAPIPGLGGVVAWPFQWGRRVCVAVVLDHERPRRLVQVPRVWGPWP